MKISIKDIKNRIFRLNESYSFSSQHSEIINLIQEEAFQGNNISAIITSLKSYSNAIIASPKDESLLFDKMLDLYELVAENGTDGDMNIVTHYLYETIDRVRDPKEMQTLLKRRITMGTKQKGTNKLLSKLDDNKSALSAKQPKQEPAKTQLNVPKVITGNLSVPEIKTGSTITKKTDIPKDNDEEKSKTESCYEDLINRCNINIEVDRILENYNRLSKRFNLDKVLSSMDESITLDIDTYCELFDTYQMSEKSKFNVAIETALYLNEKYNIGFKRNDLINAIVEYTLFKNDKENIYDTVYEYLTENSMITESDLEPFTKQYERIHNIHPISQNKIAYLIEAESKNPDKNLDSSIKDFKSSDNKTPGKVKQLIGKAYNKTPDQIVNDTPKLFDIFRFFITIGSFGLNPVLGLVTFTTDEFLKRDYRRPDVEKMINKYEKEIDKVDKKIDKTNNENKRKDLKEYKNRLYSELSKLKDYEAKLYSDKELEQREEEKNKSYSDDDFNLDEAVAVIKAAEVVNELSKDVEIEDLIYKNINLFIKNDMLDDLTEFAIQSDGFISLNKLKAIYELALNDVKGNKNNIGSLRYIMMDTLKSNIAKMNESHDISDIDDINRIISCYSFVEALQLLDTDSSPYFLEVSFNNTFNIVKTKIQSAFQTMSDKEKQLSKNIDMSLAGFKNSVEGYFNSQAREQVLRGNILPSASKMLKMALAAGLTSWLIHPVVAVIGILGYIGVSKYSQHKERELILDELDTEIEMVDKYLDEADRKGDLKATKNLLTTKKKLQREKSRIKYKLAQKGQLPTDPGTVK